MRELVSSDFLLHCGDFINCSGMATVCNRAVHRTMVAYGLLILSCFLVEFSHLTVYGSVQSFVYS